MQRKPLVSIITPAYNSGRFLEACIQSVLDQDYPNIEHIIQDAGSNDQTVSILKKYSKKEQIRWISQKDNGQSDGLNKAIGRSKGEILIVLNADDMLMPYACSWAVENMEVNPNAGVIYGDVYLMNDHGKITKIVPSKEYSFEKLLTLDLVPPAQAAFIRRTSLEKVGFHSDKKLDTCPDFEMWVRLGSKFPMKHVFGVITKYRTFYDPQPDSGKKRTAERFVKAKKIVLDRLFNNKKTPADIRKLRIKSYAGLYNWGAITAQNLGQFEDAAKYTWLSIYYKPVLQKLLRILQSYKFLTIKLILKYCVKHSFLKILLFWAEKETATFSKKILSRLRVNFIDVDINKVESYWNKRPCNVGHSSSPLFSRKYFDEVERKKYFVESHIPKFAEFEKWKGKKVLEIGCGIGTDTINFARNGAYVTAVDLSEESLKIARRRVRVFHLEKIIKFYRSNAETLSATVPVETYDLVYSFGVIHHTPHPQFVISEIRKYCDQDTILKIMVYNRISWKVLWIILKYGKGMFWNFNSLVAGNSEATNDSPVSYTYTKKSITRLLRGFDISKIEIDHIFPYEISLYKKSIYKKVFYFRCIPEPVFRLLERHVGWHLLVEAKLRTNF